jgi:hypothetical protein
MLLKYLRLGNKNIIMSIDIICNFLSNQLLFNFGNINICKWHLILKNKLSFMKVIFGSDFINKFKQILMD